MGGLPSLKFSDRVSLRSPGFDPNNSKFSPSPLSGVDPISLLDDTSIHDSSFLRTRTAPKRHSSFLWGSAALNSSMESAAASPITPSPGVTLQPLATLTQAEPLEDKQITDNTIPIGLFDQVPSTSPSPKTQTTPPPEGQHLQTTTETPNSKTRNPPQHDNRRKWDNDRPKWDRSWGSQQLNWVSPFFSKLIALDSTFLKFLEGIPWGPDSIFFKYSKLFLWKHGDSIEHILEILSIKAIVPHSIVWLPFIPELLDHALKRLFRISFCGYASTIVVCPFFKESIYLSCFLDNPKHGSILLTKPVKFCSFQCIVLLLNFEISRHLSVENDFSGIFSVDPSLTMRIENLPFNFSISLSILSKSLKTDGQSLYTGIKI